MFRTIKDNGLSITIFVFFLFSFLGQVISGYATYNEEQEEHRQSPVGMVEYLTSGHFIEATFENWESEFLQMGMFVLLTVFLYQKGSPESKKPDEEEPVDEDPRKHRHDKDAPVPVRKGGAYLQLYNHSLTLTLFLLFFLSFSLHVYGGVIEFNEEEKSHGNPPVSALAFMGRPQFWFQSFQNWQSEFLSIWALIVLSIYLREKGSPESKPVHAPHEQTGND